MYATDNTTNINALGLGFALLMSLLMLVLPRRHALAPLLAMVCMMTMGQRVLVLDLNFTLLRVLLLFGLLRMLVRGEARDMGPQPIDRALLAFVLSSIVIYTLQWQTGEAFVNRMGMAYDALGVYLLCRALLREVDDLRRVVAQLAVWVVVLAASMTVEKQTGLNPFGVFGGVPPQTLVREGVLRCQGSFAHPILAGAFGSAMVPLFAGLVMQRRHGLLPWLGLVGAGVVVWAAASSGPLLAALVGVLGMLMWTIRSHMRSVRWLLLLSTVGLHLVMQAPVWFLMARASVFGGSTGYFRSILIQHAVDNFSEWWLLGVRSTAHWGFHTFDVTNQYILIGVQGGLLSMLLFIWLIARAYGTAGRAVQRLDAAGHRAGAWMAWSLGCSLTVHAVNYLSVPYFDQNIVNWYLLLAMLATVGQASASQPALAAAARAPRPTPPRRRFHPAVPVMEAGR